MGRKPKTNLFPLVAPQPNVEEDSPPVTAIPGPQEIFVLGVLRVWEERDIAAYGELVLALLEAMGTVTC